MSYSPGSGPYSNPHVTISSPLAPPPQQFTNWPTLINGGYKEAGVMIFWNGLLQTEGSDYTRDGGKVTMVTPPGDGDNLTARVYAVGKQLGGPGPERYVAPWTLRLAGLFDGVSLDYQIVFGPSISGVCDGVNRVFTWQVCISRGSVFRNGVLQTNGVDVAVGQTSMAFLGGSVPQSGDIITMLGF